MRPAWIALAPALVLAVPSSAAAPARTGLYWGVGRAQDLARGLRAALEKTGARLGAM